MIQTILRKIFGSRNDRLLKQYGRQVRAINALEPQMESSRTRSCAEDRRVPQARQDRLARFPTTRRRRRARSAAEERASAPEALDELLPEAFAVVREAGKRALNMRHFDVQLIGGMVLHNGKIAEMRTGEGKTLVATLPAYLNALAGEGVHIVTVNDYLAQRDADWMGKIYGFLGLTVGVNLSQMEHDAEAGAPTPPTSPTAPTTSSASTTCATTWCTRPRERVQRGLNYAIVDEVDSILIDEARTPLIISGQAEDTTDLYVRMNEIVPKLDAPEGGERGPGDYWVDEKAHQVLLSEQGHEHAEELLAQAGLLPQGAQPLRPGQHHPHAPPERGAARAHAVPPRPALRGAERRDHHRRRVHRAPDAGPALVRRPAPGGRGEGGRRDPEREPDARHDHLPELLPHVQASSPA